MFWELPALLQWERPRSHTDMAAVGTVEGMVAGVITAVAGCTMAAAAWGAVGWEVAACITITMVAGE